MSLLKKRTVKPREIEFMPLRMPRKLLPRQIMCLEKLSVYGRKRSLSLKRRLTMLKLLMRRLFRPSLRREREPMLLMKSLQELTKSSLLLPQPAKKKLKKLAEKRRMPLMLTMHSLGFRSRPPKPASLKLEIFHYSIT
jgi:hypothetical protein